jgi:Fe-S cluster assembly protein SufB
MAVDPMEQLHIDTDYRYGFRDPENYVFKSSRGLSREVVEQISEMKGEPEWMLKFRLKALEFFNRRPMPTWGADLSEIDFGNIFYYVKPSEGTANSWEDVPEAIKNTYDKRASPRRRRSSWPAWARSTSRRPSTTSCATTSRRRA